MPKPSPSFFVNRILIKEKYLTGKEFFKEKRESGRYNQKLKEGFITAFATFIKIDPTTSIGKHTNDSKVKNKTVRVGIKQDLSLVLTSLDCTI